MYADLKTRKRKIIEYVMLIFRFSSCSRCVHGSVLCACIAFGFSAHEHVLSTGLAQETLSGEKYHHILHSTAQCAIPSEYSKDVQAGVVFHQTGKQQLLVVHCIHSHNRFTNTRPLCHGSKGTCRNGFQEKMPLCF